MNNTNPLSIAREALEELQNWFQSERKSISKGNGSSWSMFQCDEKIAEIASVLAALDAAAQQEPLPKPRFNCWSNDDGDSWLEHPADCEFIHGLKIGDTYELLAGWTSVRAAYRVTKAPDDQDDDYEVECVSHPEQNAASPAQPTCIENAENYARSEDVYRKSDVSIQVAQPVISDEDASEFAKRIATGFAGKIHLGDLKKEMASLLSAQPNKETAINDEPAEPGIYAWIAQGAAALVLVNRRPTDHSPGGVLNGSIMPSSNFYDGCPVGEWDGGKWFGPLSAQEKK